MLDNSGGTLSYAGRGNAAEARFAAGECAVLSASSDAAPDLAKRAHFELGVAPLPRYDDAGVAAPLPAESELEAVWRGEKSAPQALESYSRRISP